ncbi:MAG: transcriptional regulator ExuR [Aeromonas allosaccharophila]
MNVDVFESKRLYQKVAAELKQRIASQRYKVGERLPAERLIAEEMEVSRTVVREAIIMLEVEGLVAVQKGSGIHVIAQESQSDTPAPTLDDALLTAGPFELLQARQLLESNIAEFAATQVTKQDIMELLKIQALARNEDRARDSEWDKQFHIQVAKATQNSVLVILTEQLWLHRERNPYWRKLHEHIDDKAIASWCDDHDQILKALMRKDPQAAKFAMWQHLENTKHMLFQATTFDDEMNDDRYLFCENPVVHLTMEAINGLA